MATLEAYGTRVIGNYPFSASASDVSYDHTRSGLVAENVKDALDELAGYHRVCRVDTSTTATFADGLATINTYYSAITSDQRMSAVLRIGNYYFPTDYSGGGFSGILPDTNYLYLITVRINSSEYSRIRIKKSDLSMIFQDLSANARNNLMELYIKN